jgi:ParB family chromosome partitioning protein
VSKERRLGRGLEALLGRSFDAPMQEAAQGASTAFDSGPASPMLASSRPDEGDVTQSADGQQWLPINLVTANPYQPRTHFDEAEIADLCDSIRTHGFLQPILVRRADAGYQVIAGERRLRAAQMAGWERVPIQVRDVPDRQMAELAIVENVQRKDLNAIEKAASFKRYMDEYGCTQEELAGRVNIDRSTVSNLLRLLELPQEIKQMVERGDISAGHAKALLPLGDEHEQIEFARRIQKESMSVRATEAAVSDHIRRHDSEPLSIVDAEGNSRPSPIQPGQHLREMQEQLTMALGTKVEIKQSAKGRGRITLHFGSHEEFDRLRELLSQRPSLQTGAM